MNVKEIRSVHLACAVSNLRHLIIQIAFYECGSQAGNSSGGWMVCGSIHKMGINSYSVNVSSLKRKEFKMTGEDAFIYS